MDLSGRIALITGGTRGIGFATAGALLGLGAHVVVVGRDARTLSSAQEALSASAPGRVAAVLADLTEPEAADRVAGEAVAAFGRVDILVNSAGDAQGGPFETLTDEQWRTSLELKFFATVRMMRSVVPVMRAQGSGRIITVVGAAGRQPEAGYLPVAAANAALLAVTRGLADEVGSDGIVVLAVNPGVTRTDRFRNRIARRASSSGVSETELTREAEAEIRARTPLGRVGEAGDIAGWIAFLASDLAAHFTGQSITLDGGANRVPG